MHRLVAWLLRMDSTIGWVEESLVRLLVVSQALVGLPHRQRHIVLIPIPFVFDVALPIHLCRRRCWRVFSFFAEQFLFAHSQTNSFE